MLRLQEIREAQDLTQEELAREAGVGVRTVGRAEQTGRASLTTLQRFARVLGVKVDDFFEPERVA